MVCSIGRARVGQDDNVKRATENVEQRVTLIRDDFLISCAHLRDAQLYRSAFEWRSTADTRNFSGQERVRRSNIRLPRFLDRVYVESQYKGHPVHTLGDLLRFLQVGPDERTKTLESRKLFVTELVCSQVSEKQKIVFRRLPKRSCSK